MAWIPLSDEQLHRLFLAVILGAAVALAWIVAVFAGVPAMAEAQVARLAVDAGFQVRKIEVRGVDNLNELKVYERALAENNRAMPMVDIAGLRTQLLDLSWVQEARVSRQLPDRLVIDIVERKPHAVLRKADRLVLIDATGHELEPISPARAKGKLVLAGPGAGQQVAALGRLLAAAPALKPQVREAEWVGNRRWNLTFRTGQILALPEGRQISAKALMSFARLDGTNRLLGGKVAAFDMRAPGRVYLRVPGRTDPVEAKGLVVPKPAAAARPEPADKPKPKLPAKKPAAKESE
jgi:cell division protein FtsQ